MSTLIHFIYENNASQLMYFGAILLSIIFQIAYLITYRKKYSIGLIKVVIAAIASEGLGYFLGLTLAWIENGFSDWGKYNLDRIFVYLPLIYLILAKFLNIAPSKLIEFFTPSVPLLYSISHLGCIFPGCCHGYSCSWGIWNPLKETTLFPIQLLDCFVGFLVFILLLLYIKKHDYTVTGKAYPIFLVLFGTARFFLDRLRDNDKMLLEYSSLALHAAFAALVGAVWYYILVRKKKKNAVPETT